LATSEGEKAEMDIVTRLEETGNRTLRLFDLRE
jgi:hypothetical protein